MVQQQWLSLRACRLQSVALNSSAASAGYMPKDLGLLIRYQQSSDRGFYKARNELLTAQKERKKSEIGSESQDAAQPAAEHANPPDPPQENTPGPGLSVKTRPQWYQFDSAEDLPCGLDDRSRQRNREKTNRGDLKPSESRKAA
jgi:hypothetical protein